MTLHGERAELIYKDESYAILGACFEVYKTMGCGFLEAVYQECLEIELDHLRIHYAPKPALRLTYRDRILKHGYQPDLICYGKIVLELKALSNIADEHRAQLLNYLHATNMQLGLLLDFGHYPKLEHERIALTKTARTNQLGAATSFSPPLPE